MYLESILRALAMLILSLNQMSIFILYHRQSVLADCKNQRLHIKLEFYESLRNIRRIVLCS